ncbi:arylesterase [Mangrovibrevibacter kandeliae]|uniref:arylesterase n=1 Tax=Mangrovibrevibacter kandeliae TaxID=2968473 RepID=UPI0021197A4C|nr:arylesterase [Aurantimonas sp. CSK15Z-1]MCQ8781922.1 arylesterase [Aurantimonas sp. CSK15Z-1]
MHRFQPIARLLLPLLMLCGILPAAAQTAPQGPGTGPIELVAFGDSLSAGYGVGPGESFPEQLQAALSAKGYDVAVTNAGVSGDTTSGGLARLDWSVPQTADLVIVELGANDALRGIAPEIAEKNLGEILERLKARGTAVLLAGMLAPPNMGSDYAAAFDAIYERLADQYDVPLYPFFLDGVAADPALNQADHMHPNKQGVAVIVERMLPAVTQALDRIRPSAPGRDSAVSPTRG